MATVRVVGGISGNFSQAKPTSRAILLESVVGAS